MNLGEKTPIKLDGFLLHIIMARAFLEDFEFIVSMAIFRGKRIPNSQKDVVSMPRTIMLLL